ncbi:chitobiase/beta-hexosaminidase C-terminal domain-containing protein [Bacteriovorax sp. DB6_IX]|uniref:chitobiase/beta-hexosaminidase C-terminal domain-containing protein n=1 Tax=Bacteriovorax sp. DB6_IX TaxID=1353530 RepID=UPI000389F32B|nr:chitobiase/beta-hexosaminidase C-terminal domain-containing protein [Bacteriovorax sp. DB6_IX]EQC52410.1 hypothetical protein M901_2842 [Bacteriovorax sp. DB6_IX]
MLVKDFFKLIFKDTLLTFTSLVTLLVIFSLIFYFGRKGYSGQNFEEGVDTGDISHKIPILNQNNRDKLVTSLKRTPASIKKRENDSTSFQRRDRTRVEQSRISFDNHPEFEAGRNKVLPKTTFKKSAISNRGDVDNTTHYESATPEETYKILLDDPIVDITNSSKASTGEDTARFSQFGLFDGSSSNNGNNSFTCTYSRAQGTYSSATTVSISCSEPAQIYYCVHVGIGTCDPISSPSLYSGPLSIGPADNTYKVSFYGSNNSSSTSVVDLTYVIDSSTPSLTVNFPKLQLQTTELPLSNNTQSLSFGKPQHFYHQFNFKSHNPTSSGLNWSCEDIVSNYVSLSSPPVAIIQDDFDISVLSVSDQINQSVDLARLEVGDNYIVTVIEDRSLNAFTCQTQNIEIVDFPIQSFSASGPTPVSGSVREFSGQFQSYSHFQSPPSLTNSGSSKNQKVGLILEHGQMTISH